MGQPRLSKENFMLFLEGRSDLEVNSILSLFIEAKIDADRPEWRFETHAETVAKIHL